MKAKRYSRYAQPAKAVTLPPRCPSHHDRSTWVFKPHPDRIGMLRAYCGRCGGFVGDCHQEEVAKPAKPEKPPRATRVR